MPSETEICNLALSHLGAYTISALTDASQEARKCNLYYGPARDFVLRDFPWNFAERRYALALLSGVTPVGYDYAYQYPTNCLKARKIYNEVETAEPIDFIVTASDDLTSKMILTDEADAVLIYTAAVTSTALFDSAFVTFLSYKLAADLAIPLTKKLALQQAMLKIYGAYMGMAKLANATEAKDTKQTENAFLAARK